MKQVLKKVVVLSIIFAIVISYTLVLQNNVYAESKAEKDFKVKLSKDGNVTATYTKAKKQLFISGNGKIDIKLWALMARKFDKENYGRFYRDKETFEWVDKRGWIGKENFDIVFDKNTKVKLCNSVDDKKDLFGYGLFTYFDNQIYFNNAVDTLEVTNMHCMFFGAKRFNQPINFNTKNVTDMGWMFWGAESFNQPINFDTSNLIFMKCMLGWTDNFNQDINFNTSKVYNMDAMLFMRDSFRSSVKLDIRSIGNPIKNLNPRDEDIENILFIKLKKPEYKRSSIIPIKKLILMNNDGLNETVYQSLLKNTVANEYEFIKLGNFTFKVPADYIVKNLTSKKQEEVKKGTDYKFKKGNSYLLINKNSEKFEKRVIKKSKINPKENKINSKDFGKVIRNLYDPLVYNPFIKVVIFFIRYILLNLL